MRQHARAGRALLQRVRHAGDGAGGAGVDGAPDARHHRRHPSFRRRAADASRRDRGLRRCGQRIRPLLRARLRRRAPSAGRGERRHRHRPLEDARMGTRPADRRRLHRPAGHSGRHDHLDPAAGLLHAAAHQAALLRPAARATHAGRDRDAERGRGRRGRRRAGRVDRACRRARRRRVRRHPGRHRHPESSDRDAALAADSHDRRHEPHRPLGGDVPRGAQRAAAVDPGGERCVDEQPALRERRDELLDRQRRQGRAIRRERRVSLHARSDDEFRCDLVLENGEMLRWPEGIGGRATP